MVFITYKFKTFTWPKKSGINKLKNKLQTRQKCSLYDKLKNV